MAEIEKKFLNVKELCEYTGWGETKIRQILRKRDSTFTIKLGNRLYADKEEFDKYLARCRKYKITI